MPGQEIWRYDHTWFFADLKEKAQRKDKLARNFTEGWVEFQSKRLAKEVAANLNLSQVGGKKRSKSHDVTWNIKYLTGLVCSIKHVEGKGGI